MEGSQPVFSFLEKYASRLGRWETRIHLDLPPEADCRARANQRLPWIDGTALRPEPEQVQQLLCELLDDLCASSTSNRATLERLQAAATGGSLSGSAFLKAIFDRDGTAIDLLAERLAVPTQVLHFVGVFLARPFYALAAGGLKPILVEAESAPSACPCCGQEPALALLMPEDGQRRLWCRVCGFEWPTRRFHCAYCGNTDPASLGYFTLEGETGGRVDYCERCRHYIKTIDLRSTIDEGGAVRRDRADLLSGELDAAAVGEGFVPLAVDGAGTEWRRTGMGSDRNRGGVS